MTMSSLVKRKMLRLREQTKRLSHNLSRLFYKQFSNLITFLLRLKLIAYLRENKRTCLIAAYTSRKM